MSKGIYVIKIHLVSPVFKMKDDEKIRVQRLFLFTVVFYARAWFKCPLSSSAARNDLTFHRNILQYKEVEPRVAFSVLQSIHRHEWYSTDKLVILALADQQLPDEEKQAMAQKLHSMPREEIEMGRPEFPQLIWKIKEESIIRPCLSSLVSSNSWLVFDLLGLVGPQDWLQLSCDMWPIFSEFRKFSDFANNVSVTNDLAERGIHLVSEFVNKCEDENQRQALMQLLEYNRSLVTDLTKKSLVNC